MSVFNRLNGFGGLIIQDHPNNIVIGLNMDKIGVNLTADDIYFVLRDVYYDILNYMPFGSMQKIELNKNRIILKKW